MKLTPEEINRLEDAQLTLSNTFGWDESPQGWDYWNDVDKQIEKILKKHRRKKNVQ